MVTQRQGSSGLEPTLRDQGQGVPTAAAKGDPPPMPRNLRSFLTSLTDEIVSVKGRTQLQFRACSEGKHPHALEAANIKLYEATVLGGSILSSYGS